MTDETNTPGLALAELREILEIFADSDLRDLHLEVGATRVRVSKDAIAADTGPAPFAPAAASFPAAASAPTSPAAPVAGAGSDTTSAAPGGSPLARAADVDPPFATTEDRDGLVAVHSPAVGVFYRRPAPDKPPFVEMGDWVEPDTPVCTIEVMKMFTDVPAGSAGRVVEICAQNEELVEHGQVVLYLDPRSRA